MTGTVLSGSIIRQMLVDETADHPWSEDDPGEDIIADPDCRHGLDPGLAGLR